MAQIITARTTVELAEEAVIFLIGLRVNTPWKVQRRGLPSGPCRGC